MSVPVVLDEDTYTEAISLIIERDFFPNLAKMRAQQNYLEAQHSGSFTELQEAGKSLHQISNQPKMNTTRDSNQPVNFYNENEPDIQKRVNLQLSLDQFQTLYTSEDNASFTEILEKANIKVKEQNKWFFDRESQQLRITDGSDSNGSIRLIEANDKAPSGWKYKARNTLMYFPGGKSESWINDREARGQPKSIDHQNTHVISSPVVVDKKLAPSDRAAKQGNMTPWSQMNGLNNTEGTENSSVGDSPMIRGYQLVASTPKLSPTRVGTPEMTWGSIEGTPMLIAGSQTPGRHYSIPNISRREELGMKLSEKASKAYRKKTNEQQRSRMTPRTGAGLLSPAAQHLLRKSTGITPRADTGFGSALRNSYGGSSSLLGIQSPRLMKRPGATPTTPLFRAGVTPSVITKKKQQQ